MTNIDWTQPCETTETPPRPVRVLATDIKDARPDLPVLYTLTYIDGGPEYMGRASFDGRKATRGGSLRNVAPPKPEPVLREGYVAICDSYPGNVHDFGKVASGPICKDGKALASTHPTLIIGRIAWMSDGSPVPGGDAAWKRVHEEYVTHACSTIDELRVERDGLKAEVERLTQKVIDDHDEMARQIARLKLVYDAAVAFAEYDDPRFYDRLAELRAAIRTAQQGQPSAEIEKSCETCRHVNWPCCNYTNEIARACSSEGMPKWEAKSHD